MKSFASRILPAVAVAVALFSLNGIARADALPPDACGGPSDVGQTCSNAGTNADEDGLCVASTCHSPSPPDGGSDYECVLCEVPDGGLPVTDAGPKNDAGPTSDAGAVTVRDDAGTTSSPSSSSGCSATPDTRDSAAGFSMLVLGMIGLGLSRRKSKKSA